VRTELTKRSLIQFFTVPSFSSLKTVEKNKAGYFKIQTDSSNDIEIIEEKEEEEKEKASIMTIITDEQVCSLCYKGFEDEDVDELCWESLKEYKKYNLRGA
jgi:fructose 1,6-bisphosphatase